MGRDCTSGSSCLCQHTAEKPGSGHEQPRALNLLFKKISKSPQGNGGEEEAAFKGFRKPELGLA